jgi:hypothetical protein
MSPTRRVCAVSTRPQALRAKLLRGSHSSIVLNEHYEEEGAIVSLRLFDHLVGELPRTSAIT